MTGRSASGRQAGPPDHTTTSTRASSGNGELAAKAGTRGFTLQPRAAIPFARVARTLMPPDRLKLPSGIETRRGRAPRDAVGDVAAVATAVRVIGESLPSEPARR